MNNTHYSTTCIPVPSNYTRAAMRLNVTVICETYDTLQDMLSWWRSETRYSGNGTDGKDGIESEDCVRRCAHLRGLLCLLCMSPSILASALTVSGANWTTDIRAHAVHERFWFCLNPTDWDQADIARIFACCLFRTAFLDQAEPADNVLLAQSLHHIALCLRAAALLAHEN